MGGGVSIQKGDEGVRRGEGRAEEGESIPKPSGSIVSGRRLEERRVRGVEMGGGGQAEPRGGVVPSLLLVNHWGRHTNLWQAFVNQRPASMHQAS